MVDYVARNPIRVVLNLLSIYVLGLTNAVGGWLQFTAQELNVLAVFGLLLIPFFYAYLLNAAPQPSRGRTWAAALVTAFGLLVVAFAGIYAFLGEGTLASGVCGLPMVQTVSVGNSTVRMYRESLFMSSDIIVCKEQSVWPGLIEVTELHEEPAATAVDVKVLDAHHLRCTFALDYDTDETPPPHAVTVTVP